MDKIVSVVYDNSEKDLPVINCITGRNDRLTIKVSYVGEKADILYRIVTEEGYIDTYDAKVRADERKKTIDELLEYIYGIAGHLQKND